MCNKSCYEFGKNQLERTDTEGKTVLEVGSRNVNGTLRKMIEELGPSSYTGVDIEEGPGVDEVCSVYDLTKRFGKNAFDLVITTEMMEHVLDWSAAISELKNVLKPEGVLILTTRSKGFGYHEYPADFWRFEIEDMKNIFSDMQIESLVPDSIDPGVFIKVRKPQSFVENNLNDYKLYSMVKLKRYKKINSLDILLFKINTSVVQRAKNSFGYRIGKHFKG